MKLYIVATPIGNLEDISLRAISVLKSVDFILCEDTRVTRKLMEKFQIDKPSISFHQHSDQQKYELVEKYLNDGMTLAYVSDAGTPGINDPGGQLIEYLLKKYPEIKIIPVPGASALTTALSISGFPLEKFLFIGFMPHKKGRQTLMKEMAEYEHETVFFESVHRIIKTLEQLSEHLGERQIVVCRELTKMFETIYRGSVAQVLSRLQQDKIKGEFVVIVGPKSKK